jgi:hypothetical protein
MVNGVEDVLVGNAMLARRFMDLHKENRTTKTSGRSTVVSPPKRVPRCAILTRDNCTELHSTARIYGLCPANEHFGWPSLG